MSDNASSKPPPRVLCILPSVPLPADTGGNLRTLSLVRALDDASRPDDMNLPGFRFHALIGRDKGRYAVSASGNWRITFGWIEGDAFDVDLEDYR